jgi:hypothetical protein
VGSVIRFALKKAGQGVDNGLSGFHGFILLEDFGSAFAPVAGKIGVQGRLGVTLSAVKRVLCPAVID